MKKQIIAGLLCATTLIASVIAVSDGLSNFEKNREYQEFADVSSDWWYADSIKTAYEFGLVEGKLGGYSPDGNVTIAETIALACRLNSIYYTGVAEFENGVNAWYDTYVDYAVENKIINYGDYADYNAYATRSQYAKILNSSLPEKALPAINTVDDGVISDVAMTAVNADAIYALYRAGILTGNDETGIFTPNASILRSEVAAIVSRMADTSIRKNITLEIDYSNDEIYASNNLPDFGSINKISYDFKAKMNGGDVYFYDTENCDLSTDEIAKNYATQLVSAGFSYNSSKTIAGQDGAVADEYQKDDQFVVLMYPTSYGFGVLIADQGSYYN